MGRPAIRARLPAPVFFIGYGKRANRKHCDRWRRRLRPRLSPQFVMPGLVRESRLAPDPDPRAMSTALARLPWTPAQGRGDSGGGDSLAHRHGACPEILTGRQWNKSGHDKFGERRLTRRRFRPDPCYTAIHRRFEASRPMGVPVMARTVSTIVDGPAIRPRPRCARAGFPNRSRSNSRQSAGAAKRLAVAAAPPGARTGPAGARLRPRGTRKTVPYRDNVSRET